MNPRMNPDLTTKVLLFAIAIALWGLLLKPFWMEAELFPSIQAQTPDGFDAWKRAIAEEAKRKALDALSRPRSEEEIRKQQEEKEEKEEKIREQRREGARQRIKTLEDSYGLSGADLTNFLLWRIESTVESVESTVKRVESTVDDIQRRLED